MQSVEDYSSDDEIVCRPRGTGKRNRFIEESASDEDSEEEQVLCAEEATVKAPTGGSGRLAPSTLRRWKLVTLSHSEGTTITLRECVDRLEGLFECTRVVGVEEQHKDGGKHFHVAVESSNASRHTATDKVRRTFPEFPGRGCNVSFHKAFATMLVYVAKDQPDLAGAEFGGGYTIEEALMDLRAKRNKTVSAVVAVRRHIESGKSVAALAYNDEVAPFMLRSCGSVAKFAEFVGEANGVVSTLESIKRGAEAGDPAAAERLLVAAQIEALDEFLKQQKGRKPREKQLYCLGPSGTGKTYPFALLAAQTACFIPCLENGERPFAGYRDDLHDWVFINDFYDNVKFQTLSNLCEGARMNLNGYGCQVLKTKNVPVVFTANQEPQYKNLDERRKIAIMKRLKIVHFHSEFAEDAEELRFEDLCAFLVTRPSFQ